MLTYNYRQFFRHDVEGKILHIETCSIFFFDAAGWDIDTVQHPPSTLPPIHLLNGGGKFLRRVMTQGESYPCVASYTMWQGGVPVLVCCFVFFFLHREKGVALVHIEYFLYLILNKIYFKI